MEQRYSCKGKAASWQCSLVPSSNVSKTGNGRQDIRSFASPLDPLAYNRITRFGPRKKLARSESSVRGRSRSSGEEGSWWPKSIWYYSFRACTARPWPTCCQIFEYLRCRIQGLSSSTAVAAGKVTIGCMIFSFKLSNLQYRP